METLYKITAVLMAMMAFAIVTDGLVFIAGISLVKLVGFALIGMVVLLLINGEPLRGSAVFFFASLIYISWAIYSFTWTLMPINYEGTFSVNSWQSVKGHLYLLMVVWVSFQALRTESDLQWTLAAFMLGNLAWVYLLGQTFDPTVDAERHQIAGFDANITSVQITLGLPMAIYLLSLGKHWTLRVFAFLYLFPALFAILLTGSRTGAVVMLVGLAGFIPWIWRSNLFIKIASVGVLTVMLIFASSLVSEKTIERIFSTSSEITEGTLNERSITWARAYQEWRQQPVIGQGLGSFKRTINKHHVDYTAHNSFVSIAVELGIVGLVLYLGVIGVAFYYAFTADAQRRVIWVSLLTVAILGQLTLTLSEAMFIWLIYSLVVIRPLPATQPTLNRYTLWRLSA